MVVVKAVRPAISCSSSGFDGGQLVPLHKVSFVNLTLPASLLSVRLSSRNNAKLSLVQATKESSTASTNDRAAVFSGENLHQIATNGKATNIVWHKSLVGKVHRQEVLQQKGCVIWITGLSGSGKSTLACALCQALYSRGKLAYILDGDNVRHGTVTLVLKQRIGQKTYEGLFQLVMVHTGEVAKLFADAGIICIASVISPYRKDRDACRSLLPEGDFIEVCAAFKKPENIEDVDLIYDKGFYIRRFFICPKKKTRQCFELVFMNVPLQICEARDPKGLYKLARAGKINGVYPPGFTGIDDPYEPPLNCEVHLPVPVNLWMAMLELPQKGNNCASPCEMAEIVISYLEEKGYLQA
ncbi:Adenylyl-sulfate kinase, chloroplastic [Gossypium australe]|uniref:Adenylyl-sulfate kinase, chloroplastic n=1 Tax=Gossypium australe TaxID=47621 RepID=A0A5B6UWT2_9ROSI|nr:Adenylyl-sulfate kinase, chloroplastic [Gossypium australe]